MPVLLVIYVLLLSLLLSCHWILCISPYLVQIRGNTDQNNTEYGHFLRSAYHSTLSHLLSYTVPSLHAIGINFPSIFFNMYTSFTFITPSHKSNMNNSSRIIVIKIIIIMVNIWSFAQFGTICTILKTCKTPMEGCYFGRCFSGFLNCINGTKSRSISHINKVFSKKVHIIAKECNNTTESISSWSISSS